MCFNSPASQEHVLAWSAIMLTFYTQLLVILPSAGFLFVASWILTDVGRQVPTFGSFWPMQAAGSKK